MESLLVTNPMEAFPVVAPLRVVSLVPSDTYSLFELGVGSVVVGVTDFCTEPRQQVAGIPRVGGPKTPDVGKILSLQPDLVIANQEENSRESIEMLCASGVPVWLSFPTNVREAVENLYQIADLFRSETALARVQMLEKSIEWAEMAGQDLPAIRYFCPIWEDRLATGERWWMTFNRQTYANDVLRIINGENVFAERMRRYPLAVDVLGGDPEGAGTRDVRYPCVSEQEILAAQPDVILLPNEPYTYDQEHAEEFMSLFRDTPAGKSGRIYNFDGRMVTWHGTFLARSISELPFLFQP